MLARKTTLAQEILSIFRRNFPFIIRDDRSVINIISHDGNEIVEERNESGVLIGVSVCNENVILLLCVDKEYRRQGIGQRLLMETEEIIRKKGHESITVGVGFDYLMPGVPTSKRYVDAVNENLDEHVNEEASRFFEENGYMHSRDGNIFDMRFALEEFCREEYSIGDIINGITYRFAKESDRDAVYQCTDDALKEFTQWYKSDVLYTSEMIPKVLIATIGDMVCGALLVEVANDECKLGTVGCTSVRKSCQGKGIATNMVALGTKYLRDIGMKDAYLSYTYTGLDKMYGYAGYKIFVYYMMAKKQLK